MHRHLILALLTGVVLFSCSNTMEVTIEPYRIPVATWEGPWMAHRILDDQGKVMDWIWGIEGFSEYTWGTRYRVLLKRVSIFNPPKDSPSHKLELVKILSSKSVSPQDVFSLPLKGRLGSYIYPEGNSRSLTLGGEISVALSDSLILAELQEKLLSCESLRGNFSFEDSRLLLQSLTGDFNRETAEETLLFLFPEQVEQQIHQWQQNDYSLFFKRLEQDFPWEKLRALSYY